MIPTKINNRDGLPISEGEYNAKTMNKKSDTNGGKKMIEIVFAISDGFNKLLTLSKLSACRV